MFRIVCKSKIQNAVITEKKLHYNGSIGIAKDILEACDILQYEVVNVLNVNNANRFETYVIEEKAGSGKIALYGPAARLGEPGDHLVILSHAIVSDADAKNRKLKVVKLSEHNRVAGK